MTIRQAHFTFFILHSLSFLFLRFFPNFVLSHRAEASKIINNKNYHHNIMNSDSTLKTGTLLKGDTYKIVRFISRGGFGCTYEAQHQMLRKRVAIKEFFVKDFCNRDENTAYITIGIQSKKELVEKLRRKFIDEAVTLSTFSHPGIVRVSDVFEENGTAYFVMDYIDGTSLAEIINREGSLSESRSLRYITQVCNALQHVHDNNRLHLDIKPGNIMINKETDQAVLIDFGASKQYDEENGENTSTLMGRTPGYAPLEQIGNDVVKFLPATDIYSLGATLYKALTGTTPLSANMLASGEVLDPLPSTISTSTASAIAAAMQLNKAKRPQTVREFLNILQTKQTTNNEVTIIDWEPSINTDKETKQDSPITPFSSNNQTDWLKWRKQTEEKLKGKKHSYREKEVNGKILGTYTWYNWKVGIFVMIFQIVLADMMLQQYHGSILSFISWVLGLDADGHIGEFAILFPTFLSLSVAWALWRFKDLLRQKQWNLCKWLLCILCIFFWLPKIYVFFTGIDTVGETIYIITEYFMLLSCIASIPLLILFGINKEEREKS